MQDNNDLNAGAAVSDIPDSTASGSQGANSDISSGTPDNQNGSQTNSGNDQISKYREEVKRLNQALVDAKRGNRNNNPQNNQNGANPFETPEGQYGIALQLATGKLRDRMENVFSFYPEIPNEEVIRIRKNPWAFSSLENYQDGNWEGAALEIEQALLARAEELSAKKTVPQNPNPADVNANPAPGSSEEDAVVPGSPEDSDPWTMPLDKLKAQKDKAVARVSQTK